MSAPGSWAKKVLIVDDQPEFVALVKEILKPCPDCCVVGEAADAQSAERLAELARPDVVLVDIEIPGRHGLEIAADIRRRLPHSKVVLMSAYHEQEYREEALRAGVVAFIPKMEFSLERLHEACGPRRA